MQLCGMASPICWDDVILEGLQNWRRKVFKAHVCRLAFGANVYHIWRNRNALRHRNNPLSEEQLLQKIKGDVRCRVMGKGKFKRTKGNESICCNWGIDVQILI
jgi:superfamily II helicase